MMDFSGEQAEFIDLLQRVQEGCEDSARRLYEMYGDPVLRVVRRRLHRRMRSQFDSADLAQVVWASFFALSLEPHAFQNPEELVRFLCALAEHKSTELFRQRMQTVRRNVTREQGFHEVGLRDSRCAAGTPTPSQLVSADEQWESLMRHQPPEFKHALALLRQGHTYREISEQTGLSPKAIQRRLRRLSQGSQR